jgi:hypothetical protein
MFKKMSLFLPHFDDELFILPLLMNKSAHIPERFWDEITIYFTVEDPLDKRKKESLKVLSQFKNVRCVFLGDIFSIKDGGLSHSKEAIIQHFLNDQEFLSMPTDLFCPMFEGGHVDHDALFELVYVLKNKTGRDLYTFSTYNAYHPVLPVVVSSFKPGPVSGDFQKYDFSLISGFRSFLHIFNYVSQWKILTFLLPGLFHLFLVRRYFLLLKVESFNNSIPHPGKLFYDSLLKHKIKQMLGLFE